MKITRGYSYSIFLVSLLNLILFPAWVIAQRIDYNAINDASSLNLLVNVLVLPVFLTLINLKYSNGFRSFGVLTIFQFLLIIVSIFLGYVYWAFEVGNFSNPDGETIAVIQLELLSSFIVLFVSVCIALVTAKILRKFN